MNPVTIKNGMWTAVVVPDFGMNLISLKYGEKEIMRCPADMAALEERPRLHGIPILIPANRTADGTFTFEGKTHSFPINEPQRNNNVHGLMSTAPFEVISRTESEITARYQNRGDRYPYPFDMTVTAKLTEEGLEHTLTLHALEKMPYTFAYHTTFAEPKQFSVPIGRLYVRDERLLPTGEMMQIDELGETYDSFFESVGNTAKLDEFLFTVSENFDSWVLFNGDGKSGFLCVEPQCGLVNGLNIPGGHRVLEADEKEVFTLRITHE